MSQEDYVLANQTGANFRSDLNNQLLAIVSQNSGATAPATTYAFQLWMDTTTGLLKIRNAANSAWVTIGTAASTNLGLAALGGATFTGQLVLAAGVTIGAPDIAFTGDLDTGIYWISANKFAIVANGAAVLTFDASNYPTFAGTKGVLIPVGTTAQRPTGASGIVRLNTDLTSFEGYNGTAWVNLGGGGGGAGFQWREISGTAPVLQEEYGELVYMFGGQLTPMQELYASLKVPQSYSAGTQIRVYVSAYSPSSSNTQLLSAQATLNIQNTTAVDATTNQRTTTNAALTNAVAKRLRQHILDVTDSSGQINGQAVSAGDVIKIRLYRDNTDTDSADVRMIPNGTDVKYG